MTVHSQKFGATLAEVHSFRPSTERVLVERNPNGELAITSSLPDGESTVQMLDEAMEAIDGHRLPPRDA